MLKFQTRQLLFAASNADVAGPAPDRISQNLHTTALLEQLLDLVVAVATGTVALVSFTIVRVSLSALKLSSLCCR